MQLANQLEVYDVGELTVVGFGGREVLTGVRLIPSGMLGMLCAIRNEGVEVHLYNPSQDVREVLEITKLDSLLEMHEVQV